MENVALAFKSEKLTKEDKIALMLLGGDCGDILEGVDTSDGLDQSEVDIINDAFDWLNENDENGYVQFNEDGTVEVNMGNMGETDPYDERWTESDWKKWKEENGYQ